jgi:hypothetical protein
MLHRNKKLVVLALLLMGVFAPACLALESGNDPVYPNPHSVFELIHVLHTPFAVTGEQLALCSESKYGLPPDTFKHLCMGHVGAWKQINKLSELRGHVVIASPSQALSYVRLLTSPKTTFAFAPSRKGIIVEVANTDSIDSNFTYGDQELIRSLRRYPFGWWALMPPDAASRCGFTFASVSKSNNSFSISRILFEQRYSRHGSVKLFWLVRELVGNDGSYSEVSRTKLNVSKVTSEEILIPMEL